MSPPLIEVITFSGNIPTITRMINQDFLHLEFKGQPDTSPHCRTLPSVASVHRLNWNLQRCWQNRIILLWTVCRATRLVLVSSKSFAVVPPLPFKRRFCLLFGLQGMTSNACTDFNHTVGPPS